MNGRVVCAPAKVTLCAVSAGDAQKSTPLNSVIRGKRSDRREVGEAGREGRYIIGHALVNYMDAILGLFLCLRQWTSAKDARIARLAWRRTPAAAVVSSLLKGPIENLLG